MRSTARSPASMSTPASAYVRGRALASASATDGRCLEHGLGERHRYLGGVLAGEARRTEPGAGRVDGGHQVVEAEIGDGVDTEVVLDLGERQVGGEQLGARPGVDAVEARPLVRR